MARLKTYEDALTAGIRQVLERFSSVVSERLFVLEKLASLEGGFDFHDYCTIFKRKCPSGKSILETACALKRGLVDLGIPISIGISILAREETDVPDQKEHGAFYTDFRLAKILAQKVVDYIREGSTIADLASGSGILLSAVCECLAVKGKDFLTHWISNNVYSFDLSPFAIRATIAALSSYLPNCDAVQELAKHCNVGDSLLSKLPCFDVVVGNPPWGKIKLSKYAFAKKQGIDLTYGDGCQSIIREGFKEAREVVLQYADAIRDRYDMVSGIDTDMYMAFLQKSLEQLTPHGNLAILIPGGFIRSHSMARMREWVFSNLESADIKLFTNRPRFFSIDSRFRFILLSGQRAMNRKLVKSKKITVTVADALDNTLSLPLPITYTIGDIMSVRDDFSIPECRNEEEKHLFSTMCKNGCPFGCMMPAINLCRELDMTLDKNLFRTKADDGCIPLIEGRMIQPFRFGAKAYVSGTGRSAKWIPCKSGVKPQFYVDPKDLPSRLQARIKECRAGFCDIAGQTNERGMMTTVIPKNVICGNKVPTITFHGKDAEKWMLFWVGVTNSFVFDWFLRRVLSTTVNMFLLNGLPFPNISLNSAIAKTIVKVTKDLVDQGEEFYDNNEQMSHLRATLDATVMKAYGLSERDIDVVMDDFPLLDRGQPPLSGERQSLITRDLVLACACSGEKQVTAITRVTKARRLGARAYLLKEMSTLVDLGKELS